MAADEPTSADIDLSNEAASIGKAKDKDAFKVFVGGLPFRCDKDTIKEHFSQCGEIEWLHVPGKANGKPQGIAFISYHNEDCMSQAIALDGSDFMGLKLKVNRAGHKPAKEDPKAREVFIGGIPFSCTRDTIKTDFSECGEIERLQMPMHGESRSKGVAFVTYKTAEGASKALTFDGTLYGSCKLTVRSSKDKPDYKPKVAKAEKSKKTDKAANREPEIGEPEPFEVIVRGLLFKTTEDSVKETFSACGDIKRLRMPLNKRGKCHGFAFVAFTEKKGMKRALKLDGTEVEGREIHVERVWPQDDAAPLILKENIAIDASGEMNEATATDVGATPSRKRVKHSEDGDGAVEEECKKPKTKRLRSSETAVAFADDSVPVKTPHKMSTEESIDKDEIMERTIANREKRKAKRNALKGT